MSTPVPAGYAGLSSFGIVDTIMITSRPTPDSDICPVCGVQATLSDNVPKKKRGRPDQVFYYGDSGRYLGQYDDDPTRRHACSSSPTPGRPPC